MAMVATRLVLTASTEYARQCAIKCGKAMTFSQIRLHSLTLSE